MADDKLYPPAPASAPAPSVVVAPIAVPASSTPKPVYLTSYPKIVFLYPTWLTALFCGIYMSWVKDAAINDGTGPANAGLLFLAVLAVNMIVLSFDFPRATSLTFVFGIVALVLGGWLLAQYYPNVVPMVADYLSRLQPRANATFYYSFFTAVSVIYLIVLIQVQFDYWEVRPNELLHHHGVLSDLERFSAPSLRIDKEINDLFEYMLLHSGRLILQPHGERAIILDNVPFIKHKERQIMQLLGALKVDIRDNDDPPPG